MSDAPRPFTSLAACVLLPAVASMLGASPVRGQAGCTMTVAANPPRGILTCADGLTITAEPGSAYRLLDRNGDGKPEAAQLNERGLHITLPAGGRSRFQIQTPHAIASVRGTVFAADVSAARTSVFVVEGVVGVRPQRSRQTATLQAGDGVDVEAATVAPEVKRWSPARAAALLARFGR